MMEVPHNSLIIYTNVINTIHYIFKSTYKPKLWAQDGELSISFKLPHLLLNSLCFLFPRELMLLGECLSANSHLHDWETLVRYFFFACGAPLLLTRFGTSPRVFRAPSESQLLL
jgi:hypothetical protein